MMSPLRKPLSYQPSRLPSFYNGTPLASRIAAFSIGRLERLACEYPQSLRT